MTEIVWTPDMVRFIEDRVDGDRYSSPTEVVREALRLLELAEIQAFETFRQQVQMGIDQLDRGESFPAEQVFEELKALGRREAAT